MPSSEAQNPRSIAQSLQTAVEGTAAEALLENLASDRKDAMMRALSNVDNATRDSFFQKFMRMNGANAQELVSEAIAAGNKMAGINYTVQKGDSLSKIAKAHNISLDAIVKANPQIENIDLIYPNQKIKLPEH